MGKQEKMKPLNLTAYQKAWLILGLLIALASLVLDAFAIYLTVLFGIAGFKDINNPPYSLLILIILCLAGSVGSLFFAWHIAKNEVGLPLDKFTDIWRRKK